MALSEYAVSGAELSGGPEQGVTASLELQWHIIDVTASLELQWDIQEDIDASLDLRWQIYGEVNAILGLYWHVFGRHEGRVLVIWDQPPVAWFDIECLVTIDDGTPRLLSVGTIRNRLRTGGSTETSNATAELENADGAILPRLQDPPLGVAAGIFDQGVEVFSGIVSAIRFGPRLRIDLEAGGARRYTDPLPLGTTTDLGVYAVEASLPLVYGLVTLTPIRADATGRYWLLAGHPVSRVVAVHDRAGAALAGWEHRNTTAPSGRPVAILRTLEAYSDDDAPTVTLEGKIHPGTGELLERPDQVLWDLLANVAGMPVEAAQLDALRSDSQGQSLTIGGVLDDHTVTVQSAVDQIAAGAGLAWSPDASGIAMLWPREPEPQPDELLELGVGNTSQLTAETQNDSLVTVVELAYDRDWATGERRRTLRMEAPTAINRWGRIEARIPGDWLHSNAAAIAYATRWLQSRARPLWRVAADARRFPVRPGDSIAVDHPMSPVTAAIVTTLDRGRVDDRIEAVANTGTPPEVVLIETGEQEA